MNTTLVRDAVPAAGRGSVVLVILDPACPRTALLPSEGVCTIGRGTGADIAVDDGEASRAHARLRLVPGTGVDAEPVIMLTDNRSRNGTFVAGKRMVAGETITLALGETFQIGGTLLMVQWEPGLPRPHRLFSHAYLVARLDEECARHGAGRRRTAVVARFRLQQDRCEEQFVSLGREILRPFDVLAHRSPREFTALLQEISAEAGEALVLGLAEAARGRGIALQAATAVLPGDAGSSFELLNALEARLEPPRTVQATSDGVMDDVLVRLRRAAAASSAVLLLGETGTGKSYLAERLHTWSPRAQGPFVMCDCGALSRELVESELFGHARGAFTGAASPRVGLIEAADGGTLFLDEIAELPLEQQVKMLTVLDGKRVRRMGENQGRAVDFRLVAATSQDLRMLVKAGRFRPELYYRLNVIRLCIPPLRERPAALVALAEGFLAEVSAAGNRRMSFAPETLTALRAHVWPGNIRELRHSIERAVAIAQQDVLRPGDFELEESIATVPAPATRPGPAAGKWQAAEVTREQLVRALLENGGNRTRAGKALGRSREWLRQRCIELGIPLGR
jgi:two-component system, NtrC family, response regulator AtoC